MGKAKQGSNGNSLAGDSKALSLVNYIVEKGIDGFAPLSSCEELAQEYLLDQSYSSDDDRVSALIKWETSKNFTSGFLAGLGGAIALPVIVPAALGASWLIQARMAGAIACIYGHSLDEDRVQTLILVSLLGDAAKEPLKQAGIKIGQQLTSKAIKAIPGKALIEINKKVGFRLLTKAGEKGVINFTKGIPFVGGLIGGVIDAYMCRVVGKTAQDLFSK